MIIQDIERKGIAKILNYLNYNDLNDLVLTITNRLIKDFKADESIPLILNYSESSLDFLKKKKIKKELIFKYLKDEKIYVKTNSTKSDLIRECLKYWGSAQVNESMEVDDDSDTDKEEIVTEKDEIIITEIPNEINHQLSIDYPQNSFNNQLSLSNQQFCNLSNQQFGNQSNQQFCNQSDNQIMQLAINYGQWFFSLLPEIVNDKFNVDNFYNDSQMRLIILINLFRLTFEYNNQSLSLNQMGNHRIVEMLKNLILCKLKFKPNLLPQFDGVRAEFESHGLLKVIYNGILYLDEEPVGWFENLFGLIPDSTLEQHNWRIKFLDGKLKLSKPIPNLDHYIQIYKQITN